MKIERKKNAIKGTLSGIILKLVQIIFPFAIRTIFIRTLGVEYLGLNSLFTAILQVLNLAELGVASALVFSMYKPIVDDDKEKICQLMNLYRRYYRIIGLVVFAIGLAIIPFLPNLIKGNIPSDVNIYILYGMHLFATVLSYWLFAYRNSLFLAHQRNDIINTISIVIFIVFYILEAVSLLIVRNYYLYLSLHIVTQVLNNVVTAIFSRKIFNEYKPKGELPLSERKAINKQVKSLFTAKIGSVINNSADSIVISALLGLEVLAVYQNYYYIISAIMAMFSIFFSACTAGIGNSLIVNNEEQNRQLLYNINHIVFLAINICCSCFVCACQPFIKLWVGEGLMLDFSFVLLFALYLFAEEAPRTLIAFKDAGGIWKHDRFRPLISAAVNLTLNLILTPLFGLYGIIISTIIAFLFVSFPWVVVNINNRLFIIRINKYFARVIAYVITTVISVTISYLICSGIQISNSLIEIAMKLLICSILPIVIYFIAFFKTSENNYLIQLVYNFIKKHHRKL